MKLPKRVPWADISELEQVFSWIYTDEEDTFAKIMAVNRLAAWKANTTLPHALESILSLLVVILEDGEYTNNSLQRSSSLNLRQSYALALIRMVNGLVDPFQQGVYARSIAGIAAQIGLPLWLVELRHAGTHEELPSLELLREGAREGMSWFLHNYFLPTLSPTAQSNVAAIPLPPVTPLLSQYKQLQKSITRDLSLKSHLAKEMSRILYEFDRWISEAKVTASLVTLEAQSLFNEEDAREQWALEQLSQALIDRGGLVPVSKRKRSSSLQSLSIPSQDLLGIWSPLLIHLHTKYPLFPSVLLSRILSKLLPFSDTNIEFTELTPMDSSQEVGVVSDLSYDYTLASWGLWIIERWASDEDSNCSRGGVVKDVLLRIRGADNKAARALLGAVTEKEPQLKEAVAILSSIVQPSSSNGVWDDNALHIMSERLSTLQSQINVDEEISSDSGDVEMAPAPERSQSTRENVSEPRGWRLLSREDGWKPCPIGMNGLLI